MMDKVTLDAHLQNKTLDRAVAELQKECAEAMASGEIGKLGTAQNDLGVVYLMMGRMQEAREQLSAAQRSFIEAGDAAGQGRAVGNMAQLEERAGNVQEAGVLYMQAADLLHEGDAFADEYATRKHLSALYTKQGATMMALQERSRALGVKPNAGVADKVQRWLYAVPSRLIGVG